MDDEDWMGGGGNDGGERDNYSYEDSEQFDEDDMLSMGTEDGCARRDDWDGWDGERDRQDNIPFNVPLDDLPSTSGLNAVGNQMGPSQQSHNGDPLVRGSSYQMNVRALSAASTLSINGIGGNGGIQGNHTSTFPSLFNIAVKACARHLTFYALEKSYNHARLYRYTLPPGEEGERLIKLPLFNNVTHTIPHEILQSILEYCFPDGDDDIRLYCCLANGSIDEFNRGDFLYKNGSVENVMQIGFLLTADVYPCSMSTALSPSLPFYGDDQLGGRRMGKRAKDDNGRIKSERRRESNAIPYKVSLGIDRCRVVSCECECGSIGWCNHMVAVCLYRIHQKKEVEYRGTMWDSINELDLHKCRKLSQWLVNELPRKFIPVAQRLLDGLKDNKSVIFQSEGAPDPTDGGHEAISRWFMSRELNDKVAAALYKFCQPSPTVHCDVQFLSASPPAIYSEWQLLLQPLKSKRPEGIWNLLSITRALFKKRDANATSLLHVITDQVLASTHMLLWWLITSLQQSGKWTQSADRKNNPLMSNYEIPQLCGSALCEEIVSLWRIAALNPAMKLYERRKLASIIQHYHKTAVERLCKVIDSMGGRGGKGIDTHNNIFSLLISSTVNEDRLSLSTSTLKFTKDCFPGFFPALQACHLTWSRSELSSLPPDITFSLDSTISPYLPQTDGILRRPYTVASTCPPNSLYPGYRMVEECVGTKKKKKSKKKKGSSSKKNTRRELMEALEQFDLDELESAESGQESDMAGTSSGTKKGRSSSYPYEDLDHLFADAHSPLEGLILKLARCEALFSHGHNGVAAIRAAELIENMRVALSRIVYNYDDLICSTDIRDDSSLSSSIPITPTKHTKYDYQRNNSLGGVHPSQYFNTTPHHIAYGNQSTYSRNKYVRVVAIPDGIQSVPSIFPTVLPNYAVHTSSEHTCNTVERALILAKLLSSYSSHRHSVFRLLVDVLETPKGAMSTNHLQVKLFHLESEVLLILNKMNFDAEELKIIREKASNLARMDLYPNGRTENGERIDKGVPPVSLALFIFNSLIIKDNILLREEDEDLGVGASLFVLGARNCYAERDFPMLGESLRRQRGDLALRLMRRYKDDSHKLGLILDRLLDSSQHRMYKHHKSNGVYFLERDAILGQVIKRGERPTMINTLGYLLKKKEKPEKEDGKKNEEDDKEDDEERGIEGSLSRRSSLQQSVGSWESGGVGNGERSSIDESEESGGTEDRSSISTRRSSDEGNDSSSNSISHSTSQFVSSNRVMGGVNGYRNSSGYTNNTNGNRMNKKSRISFTCEAHSHYMVELSKRILAEAGGDQSSSVFIHAPNNHGPHRKLQMCSFLIGLYALGLSNKASHSWTSRTYSTHSGCLTDQALGIGSSALGVMKDIWSLHFTPSEAASLADKAGRLSDGLCVDLGAQLALSVLDESHALSCQEGIRAIDQCKEKGNDFLEKAITAVERASTREEVFPDILFRASRLWADTVGGMEDTSFNANTLQNNPFYHHAAAIMQHQQATVNVYGGGGGGGSVPPPLQYPIGGNGPLPSIVRQLSRGGEGDGGSESSTSSGSVAPPLAPPLNRPSMHLSHSAPNLNGVMGSIPQLPPSIQLPTKHDPRLERLARAQRIGLKAMECMWRRGGEEDKKYSKNPPNATDIIWLFKLSNFMGTHYILLFCEMCCKTVCSPHLLASFVLDLLRMFPNMHHGSLRLAATAYRPPQGIGQGKFRACALSIGWQPPTADVFDRAMESAYEAIVHKMKPNIQRLSAADADEIMMILTRMKGILSPPQLIPSGFPLFEELASFCLKYKAIKSHKELTHQIQSLIYGVPQYPFQG